MKNVIAIVLLLMTTAGAPAETELRPKIFVSGGVAVPAKPSEFTDGYNIGFGSGIGIGVEVNRTITVLANFNLDYFDLDESRFRDDHGLPPGIAVEGGGITTLYVSAGIRVNMPWLPTGSVDPYVLGGGGFFRSQLDIIVTDALMRTVSHEPEDGYGLHVGGGTDFPVSSRLDVFLEAYYVVAVGDSSRTGYVAIRVGVAYDLGPGQD